jgi:hypothetical protein
MATEDTHFTTGPGRCFQKVAVLARTGAEAAELAIAIVDGLREHLHKPNGPASLASLAIRAGVRSDPARLDLTPSNDEMDRLFRKHRQEGRCHDRKPQAELEILVVQRERLRVERTLDSGRPLCDLYCDYCVETARSLVLGRVEQSLGETPTARLAVADATATNVRELLEGPHRDIIESLVEEPSGKTVRKNEGRANMSTADKMLVPLPVMPQR